ncbi:MAG: PKD repeat protein [Chlorobi bacterium OLB5]|nr:MAG: PKD repeat protein [Chlorobi bacterium OLB5]
MKILNKTARSIKRKVLMLCAAIIFCSANIFGQSITWQRTYLQSNWTTGNSIKQTSDGNYVIAGRRGVPINGGFVAKLNSMGDTLWVRYLPVTIGMTSVIETASGEYVAVGDDRLIAKFRPDGNMVWLKYINEPGYDIYFYHLTESSDLNIVAVGKAETGSPTIRSGYMVKIDTNGNKIWSKIIRPNNTQNTIQHVKQLTNGGFILSGGITIINNIQVLLIKTNNNGDTLWTRSYGSNFLESGNAIFQTADNGYLTIGTIRYTNQYIKLYFTKTDSSGNFQWSKIYGDTNTYFNLRSSDCAVRVNYNNTYVITGVKATEAFLLAINSNGEKIWEKTYSMDTLEISGSSVDLCDDSTYIVCGDALNFPPADLDPQFLYVLKTTKADPIGIISNETTAPLKFKLYQNYPNPFNPNTEIKFEIPISSFITIKLFDVLGREIRVLANGIYQPGVYRIYLNVENYNSGVYFVNLTDNQNYTETKKIVLIE